MYTKGGRKYWQHVLPCINRGSWSHDNHNNCNFVKPSSTRNLKNVKRMLLCTPLPHMSITLASNSNMSCWSWASPLSSSWLGLVLGGSHLFVRTAVSSSWGKFREPPHSLNFFFPILRTALVFRFLKKIRYNRFQHLRFSQDFILSGFRGGSHKPVIKIVDFLFKFLKRNNI